MRPAAPCGDLRGRDGPLTPSPLTAAATMKDRGGEGAEVLGDGGAKLPPSPRNSLPLPDSRGRESQPQQGEGQGVGVREASALFRNLLVVWFSSRPLEGLGRRPGSCVPAWHFPRSPPKLRPFE